ncbi:MAG: hypothetical protein AB7T22_13295 [Calditrichaceae bacterium]
MEDQEKDIAYELAKEIHHNLSGKEDGKANLELLNGIEQLNKEADNYLKKIGSSTFLKYFEKVKSTDKQDLIDQIKNNYSSITSKTDTIADCIKKIYQTDLNQLFDLSYYGNGNPVVAILLALIIEAAKTEGKNNKISVKNKKEIFVFMVANEMESLLKRLKTNLKSDQILRSHPDALMNLSEYMYRLGYLSGLLDSEQKLQAYHHGLTSRDHYVTGKGKHTDIENKYREKIRSIVQDYVKRLYKQGCKKMHNKVADEIRQPVVDFLEHKNSGKNFDEEDLGLDEISKNIIEVLKDHQTRHLKSWSDFYDVLKLKRKKDFFREAVRYACPEKYIRGRKRS